ncbi:hypothetical protein [Paracoccus sp. SCSIO 75233]|uniref:hypothetical protein n=1 Tax=Paracoccus sp. SCSIO 75233 TaxID=3017782 RepID=UPI0022F0B80B|nr:hypothetical protein [Paracoccus sp. SCSIO 75233]WBU54717.1 hypothetical protein PAF12_07795 [Paracoccus sp. SCSIO 75233]
MTIMPIEQRAGCDLGSPLARMLNRLAAWSEARHQKRICRKSAGAVPEHLRWDVGLDGGAPVTRHRPSGRSFVTDEKPGSAQSSLYW